MWQTCMHLIWLNWQAKCGRQLGKSPNRFCNSHGLNQLSTDSYKRPTSQHVDVWSSFRASHQPTFTKTTAFRLNCISQPSQKRWWKDAYLNHHGSPSLKLKNDHRVFFFAAAPKKRRVSLGTSTANFPECRERERRKSRRSSSFPEPLSCLRICDNWTFGESIDVSSWWSFSKMYYVYIILYHIF